MPFVFNFSTPFPFEFSPCVELREETLVDNFVSGI